MYIFKELYCFLQKIKKKRNILRNFLNKKLITQVIISSVVPSLNKLFIKFFSKFKISPIFISEILSDLEIKTNIRDKKSIGDDRIVNVFHAKNIFKRSVIIVDFGTATTLDVLNQKGIYDGGVITPGIEISLFSLNSYTAKLPLVKFKKTKNVVGSSTESAIQSGFFWGYVSMIEGLIKKIEVEKKCKFKVILTGGNSNYFNKLIKNVDIADEFFTSKGLNLIIRKLKKIK